MEKFKNLCGGSNILHYKMGDDYIKINFEHTDDSRYCNYEYTYESAGKDNVERMKELASRGKGLDCFIIKNVRKKYSKRW
ncbi:hypothetical protein ACFL2R_00090 [Patescibacteria group bacterium]